MPQRKMSGTAARLLVELLVGEEELNTAGRMAGLPRSSIYRAAAELARLGWLEKEKKGSPLSYSLSLHVLSSGSGLLINIDNIYNRKTTQPDPPNGAAPPQIPGLVTDVQDLSKQPISPAPETKNLTTGILVSPQGFESHERDSSLTTGISSPTGETDPLDACLAADDLPSGEFSMKPGSAFVLKRRAQTKALQVLWSDLFPAQGVLSSGNAGVLLKLAEESAYLVGVCLQDTETKGERITAPLGYVKKAIAGAVREGWMRPDKGGVTDDLAEPSPEFLAQMAQAKAMAHELWGEDDA